MTEQQLKWAAQHDWFRGVADNGGVNVYVSEHGTIVNIIDFNYLAKWAGY